MAVKYLRWLMAETYLFAFYITECVICMLIGENSIFLLINDHRKKNLSSLQNKKPYLFTSLLAFLKICYKKERKEKSFSC